MSSNFFSPGYFGAKDVRRPGRKFEIKARDFTSNDQGVPIPLLAGTARLSGIYITPVFGFRKVERQAQGAK